MAGKGDVGRYLRRIDGHQKAQQNRFFVYVVIYIVNFWDNVRPQVSQVQMASTLAWLSALSFGTGVRQL